MTGEATAPVEGGVVEIRIVRWSGAPLPALVSVSGTVAEVIAGLLVAFDLNGEEYYRRLSPQARDRIRQRVQDLPTSSFRVVLDHRRPGLEGHVLLDPEAARDVLRLLADAEDHGEVWATW